VNAGQQNDCVHKLITYSYQKALSNGLGRVVHVCNYKRTVRKPINIEGEILHFFQKSPVG
jgi:hypothetical protein